MIFEPKKLFLIIDNLGSGGAQRQMTNLAVGLKHRGYHVDVFCYSPGDYLAGPLHDVGIEIYRFIKKSSYSPDVILELQKLLRKNRYDLAISFLTTPNFYAILGSKLSFHRTPVIVSERFCDLPGRVRRLDRFVRQFYRFADHVVVNSHHQRENFLRLYPWLKGRITTIYNGYDLNELIASEEEPNNRAIRLLTIASVSPYKNGLCLVEALHVLREKFQLAPIVDWIGVHIETGEMGEYLNLMKHKITEYGLESQWNWLGERSDIIKQLHEHDALVHPSYGEGLPNVVCEALACARPVVVSNTLDHPLLVQNGVSGLLFDHKKPADLAEKIKHLSDLSNEERREMGMQGRQYAESNLTLDRFLKEYENLFDSILTR
jgi:glycosyltransferase involved in cell wall biosynthesis